MVTDGSYTCGERGINYRLVESLCCTPASNIALCVNHPIKEGGGGGGERAASQILPCKHNKAGGAVGMRLKEVSRDQVTGTF